MGLIRTVIQKKHRDRRSRCFLFDLFAPVFLPGWTGGIKRGLFRQRRVQHRREVELLQVAPAAHAEREAAEELVKPRK